LPAAKAAGFILEDLKMINGAMVTLAGYVATEPVFKTINETTPKVSLRVAWNSRFLDRVTGEWRESKTSFATVHCWRRMGSNVAPSLRKGEPIVVTGRLAVREYDDKEGRHRVIVDIDADAIGHDLSRGVTHFQRTLRSSGDEVAQPHSDVLSNGEATGDVPPADDRADEGSHGQPTGGMFDQDAVDALAATTAEPVAVGAPF
jgi:single-strand DNA-binding protein